MHIHQNATPANLATRFLTSSTPRQRPFSTIKRHIPIRGSRHSNRDGWSGSCNAWWVCLSVYRGNQIMKLVTDIRMWVYCLTVSVWNVTCYSCLLQIAKNLEDIWWKHAVLRSGRRPLTSWRRVSTPELRDIVCMRQCSVKAAQQSAVSAHVTSLTMVWRSQIPFQPFYDAVGRRHRKNGGWKCPELLVCVRRGEGEGSNYLGRRCRKIFECRSFPETTYFLLARNYVFPFGQKLRISFWPAKLQSERTHEAPCIAQAGVSLPFFALPAAP